jgi:mannose-6-phosphate isomerase-like protein (cupin superfamily)
VLSGELVLETAGRREALRAHEGSEVAPGEPHQVSNRSDAAAEFLVVSQPPSHGDRTPTIIRN